MDAGEDKTKAGQHLHSESTSSLWIKVKNLEEEWWKTTFPRFPSQTQREMTENKGLRPDSMRLYGEVLFLLLGLKPAVMITGLGDPSVDVLRSFVDAVIHKSGLLEVALDGDETPHSSKRKFGSGYIAHNVDTPFFSFKNSFLIYNITKSEAAIAEKLLCTNTTTISEKEVAKLLDYPVYLREGEELQEQQERQPSMIEVGYFHVWRAAESMEENNTLISSYGAEEGDVKDAVLPHFKRYKEACMRAGVPIKIAFTPLSYECTLFFRLTWIARHVLFFENTMDSKETQGEVATEKKEEKKEETPSPPPTTGEDDKAATTETEQVEGAPVAPGTNIASSIQKMEHQISILHKELEKVREKLAEARKEDVEDTSEEVKSKIAQLVKDKKRVKELIQFQEASVKNHRWEAAKTALLSILVFVLIHFILYLFDVV